MASSSELATRRTIVVTVVVLVVLLLILGSLAVLNYVVRRPASFDSDAETERSFMFSIYGFEGDLLRRPTGVDIDAAGNIHVADTGKRRIVVFNEEGGFEYVYGNPGQGATDLWNPIDVAVADDGRAFVVDKSENKIVLFDVAHTPVSTITFAEEPPLSVEISGEELIVTTGSGILIGTLDGELQTGYVARGKAPGQFDRPASVAVGEDGTLYVADSLNYRVQALDSNGEVLWTYGEPIPAGEAIKFSDASRKFGLPASIAADENGLLYVVDGLNGEIQILDQETGEFIETIGDIGHEDGQFYYPEGISYSNGVIAVADKFNDRVEVFRTPGATTALGRLLPLAPWLAAPALLLLLIPLFRRRSNIIARSFAENMSAHEAGEDVAKAIKKVIASPAVLDEFEEVLDGLKWKSREPDDDAVAALMDNYDLGEDDAQALWIAMHARGRKVLLTDTEQVIEAAEENGVTVVTFEDVLKTLGVSDEQAAAEEATVAQGDDVVEEVPTDDTTATEDTADKESE